MAHKRTLSSSESKNAAISTSQSMQVTKSASQSMTVARSASSKHLSLNSLKKSPSKTQFLMQPQQQSVQDDRLSCQVQFNVKAVKIIDKVSNLDGMHCIEIQRGPLKSE